jgi:hypothetical protein
MINDVKQWIILLSFDVNVYQMNETTYFYAEGHITINIFAKTGSINCG